MTASPSLGKVSLTLVHVYAIIPHSHKEQVFAVKNQQKNRSRILLQIEKEYGE